MPALMSPTHVMIVFQKVTAPPPADPDDHGLLAFRMDCRRTRASRWRIFRAQNLLVPFYTDEQGDFVGISSDTYPYPPGVPGRTRAQIAEAIAQHLEPRRISGNGYIFGPITPSSNSPATRLSVSIMFTCGRTIRSAPSSGMSAIWKRARAAGRRRPAPITEENCKTPRGADPSWPSLDRKGTYRFPTGGVSFDDVAMNWYMNQTGKPLAPTLGHLMDHVTPECQRPRCLDRQAGKGGRGFSETALPHRRHARRDDRRPQP